MTKMAVMPIYVKNLKNSSSPEPKGWWPWNLVCSIGCSSTTKFVQMMTLGWPWPILLQCQIWFLMLLCGEKGKTMDFSETIVVYDLKQATDDRSDKKFPLKSKLCPLGAVFPLPWGYMHVLNHEKNCIKSDFKEISLKLATNGKCDKAFLLTSKFCPLGAVCLCPGAIYMCKIMKKNCIKSDFKNIFF